MWNLTVLKAKLFGWVLKVELFGSTSTSWFQPEYTSRRKVGSIEIE